MKKQSKRPSDNLRRALITASAGTLIMLGQTSCGLGGMFGKGKGDDLESAVVASEEPKKKKRGSFFNRSKNSNSWIDDNVQTTRRDRYAAQNKTDFAPIPEPTPQSPAGPLTPNSAVELELDPQPTSNDRSRAASNPSPTADNMRLPSLDSDFPQPNRPPTTTSGFPDPDPGRTASRIVEEDGYVPLQPKLPKLESIEPPSE